MKKIVIILSIILLVLSVACSNQGKGDSSYIYVPENFYSPESQNVLTDCIKTIDSIIFISEINMNMVSVNIIDDSVMSGRINVFASPEKNLSIGDTVELVTVKYVVRNSLGYERIRIVK